MDQLEEIRKEHAERFARHKLTIGNAVDKEVSSSSNSSADKGVVFFGSHQKRPGTKRRALGSSSTKEELESRGKPEDAVVQQMKLQAVQNSESTEAMNKRQRGRNDIVKQGGEESGEVSAEGDGSIFDVLCWNIDGLEDSYLRLRTMGIIEVIQSKKPAAVYLQEVVRPALDYMRQRLSSAYQFIEPNPTGSGAASLVVPYFCVILVSFRKFKVKDGTESTSWFRGSMMGRHLLSVVVNPVAHSADTILLMTSHLESTKEFREERINQLKESIEAMRNSESLSRGNANLCIFGGDFNIRDAEIKAAGLNSDVVDVWQHLGSPRSCQYTWDTLLNDNKHLDGQKFKVRYRFDRMFIRHGHDAGKSHGWLWKPQEISLVGKQKLQSCDMFPSDHFGLYVRFKRFKQDAMAH